MKKSRIRKRPHRSVGRLQDEVLLAIKSAERKGKNWITDKRVQILRRELHKALVRRDEAAERNA
jgi:hypothetical protein